MRLKDFALATVSLTGTLNSKTSGWLAAAQDMGLSTVPPLVPT